LIKFEGREAAETVNEGVYARRTKKKLHRRNLKELGAEEWGKERRKVKQGWVSMRTKSEGEVSSVRQ